MINHLNAQTNLALCDFASATVSAHVGYQDVRSLLNEALFLKQLGNHCLFDLVDRSGFKVKFRNVP